MRNKLKFLEWNSGNGYIFCRIFKKGKRIVFLKHRFIMEKHLGRKLKASEDVHHIDGNKSNNKIKNLEIIDHGEHSLITNRTRNIYKRKIHSSKYFGVSKLKSGDFTAKIRRNKKIIYGGTFESEIEAAMSYDRKAKELGLKPLNFPEVQIGS